jgi:hypothetical protein
MPLALHKKLKNTSYKEVKKGFEIRTKTFPFQSVRTHWEILDKSWIRRLSRLVTASQISLSLRLFDKEGNVDESQAKFDKIIIPIHSDSNQHFKGK